MRVLRLGLGDDRTVDLHPAVSVVTGLTDEQRTALRRGFVAVGTGLAPPAAGLVEAHGMLLDATQDDLDLLDVGDTPSTTVATVAEVPGAVPDDDAARLRAAEHELRATAGARWRSSRDLARVAAAGPTVRSAPGERAAALRARIARHEARDPEAVRVALDRVRDATRAGAAPDPADLVDALAAVGLDTADLGLRVDELVRIAEDWLDERRREADWVVGARVELQGIADAGVGGTRGRESADGDVDELRRRATRSAAALADAVVRTDELRAQLLARHAPRPGADVLQDHLVARLGDHRPARLAGATPLLLDGVLGHLGDHDATRLLDRLGGLAGPVQLVVVDEHPAARAWADAVGIRRAAVVAPVAAGPLATP